MERGRNRAWEGNIECLLIRPQECYLFYDSHTIVDATLAKWNQRHSPSINIIPASSSLSFVHSYPNIFPISFIFFRLEVNLWERRGSQHGNRVRFSFGAILFFEEAFKYVQIPIIIINSIPPKLRSNGLTVLRGYYH